MLQATDISATFHPSTIQGSRSLGVGQLNVAGIIISFTVYPSNFGQGFLISFPSKPSIKNGVQETDMKTGKPKYFNEVYIADQNTKTMVENAVLNAMSNRGVYVNAPAAQPQQSYQQPQQFINGQGVSSNPSQFNQPTARTVAPTVSSPGSSIVGADDLPF